MACSYTSQYKEMHILKAEFWIISFLVLLLLGWSDVLPTFSCHLLFHVWLYPVNLLQFIISLSMLNFSLTLSKLFSTKQLFLVVYQELQLTLKTSKK